MQRTASGWSQRVRYGQDRAKRITLSPTLSEAESEARFALLKQLAEPLAKLPKSDALKFLDHAAKAPANADIEAMIALANERAAAAAQQAAPAVVTFADVAKMWTSGELAEKHQDNVRVKASVSNDVARLKHICAKVGHIPIKDFTRDDANRARSNLPARVKTAGARRQYSQVIARVLNLAVEPLALISQSPLPRGWLPKLPKHTALQKSYLRSPEDAQLLRSDVPFLRRAYYGFVARVGCRPGEALELRWRHVDHAR